MVPVYILMVSLVSRVLAHCPIPKLAHCVCSSEILNCTSIGVSDPAGFSDLQEYAQGHVSLETVVFRGHNIPLLEANVLGNVTHTSMNYLDLSSNSIKVIDPGAFHHMRNLKELILDDNEWNFNKSAAHPKVLSHNDLTLLSLNDAFATPTYDTKYTVEVMEMLEQIFVNSSMVSLRILRMNSNNIRDLPDDFFDGMPNLQVLDLSSNRMFRVGMGLTTLNKLQSLKLHSNNMYLIEDSLMANISVLYDSGTGSLRNVTLAGNPIECDCSAINLWKWLHTANGSVVIDADMIKCLSAPDDELVGTPLLNLKESQLVCNTGGTSGSYAILAVVLGLVAVVAVIVLILNRSFFLSKYLACKETVGNILLSSNE